ncbi:MAG: prolipoprotein diacylglyceryl transferase, partial [Kiritimatiellae bacterium]|nr:prolipoprotein diacylglyceryl transferase [Kiritimatiellia bacterium]
QLIEAGWNLVVYVLVAVAYRRRPYRGFPTGVYLLSYPVGRFLIEFLRGDARLEWHGLSVAQIMRVGLVLRGVGILVVQRQGARREKAFQQNNARMQ